MDSLSLEKEREVEESNTTTSSKTPGVLDGETMDMSESPHLEKAELESVESNRSPTTQLLHETT